MCLDVFEHCVMRKMRETVKSVSNVLPSVNRTTRVRLA